MPRTRDAESRVRVYCVKAIGVLGMLNEISFLREEVTLLHLEVDSTLMIDTVNTD